MEKINFQNNVTKANAETMTQFQDNIENAINEINVGIKCKTVIITKQSSELNGETIYNGFGFKPKFVSAKMCVNGNFYSSNGESDGTTQHCIFQNNQNSYYATQALINYSNFSSFSLTGTLVEFTNDGLVINWTTFGNVPLGTLNIIITCVG